MLRELTYKVGILVRNKRIFDMYRFLMNSQYWDINRLQEYQLEKIKEIVIHAYENSKYYRQKYDEHNFHPQMIRSLGDLKHIPKMTKDELLKHRDAIQIKNLNEKLFFSETSGSSGEPLVFYRNRDWDAWHRASVFRGYSWFNVKPWEKNGYLWGYNIAFKRMLKIKLLDFLQNRFRLFSYKDKEIDKFLKKLEKASFLSGYSSMIYELAKRINQKNMQDRINLKMIKGTSEKIFEQYQLEVEKAFQKKMISEYGAAETGIIAFECPEGNMHINMETVKIEEEDNKIIVTNLVSKSFPIIRYELGDYVIIDRQLKCSCGMQHHIVVEVLGRVGKVIYGLNHQYPSLIIYYIFKNLATEENLILNYQAIQKERGCIEFRIENELTNEQLNMVKREFLKYFGTDLKLTVADRVSLLSTDRKKVDFIGL